MRIGMVLPASDTSLWARAADRAGISALLVPAQRGGSAPLAAEVAAVTRDARIVVPVTLGTEHPVTLAEEIAVIDQISGGRVIALVDTAALDEAAALEDVSLLRACWSGRAVSHSGVRWKVPSGATLDPAPASIAVTPLPAQLEMPVWLTGGAAPGVATDAALPVLDRVVAETGIGGTVPAVGAASGDLAADRETIAVNVAAGVSVLFLDVPDGSPVEIVERHIARYLVPEAAMPTFPRIIAESEWPAEWSPDAPAQK